MSDYALSYLTAAHVVHSLRPNQIFLLRSDGLYAAGLTRPEVVAFRKFFTLAEIDMTADELVIALLLMHEIVSS